MIVGFSGYAQSGKDSAARILVEKFGFKQAAFATTMKDCLLAINPLIPMAEASVNGTQAVLYACRRLRDVIDEYGWDTAKINYPEIRELMQRLGTEMGRDILGVNIWVDTLFNRNASASRLTISDVRFGNEFDGVRDRHGIVVRIERPGVGPANAHISETGLDGYQFDFTINNDGTVDDLANELMRIIEKTWPL